MLKSSLFVSKAGKLVDLGGSSFLLLIGPFLFPPHSFRFSLDSNTGWVTLRDRLDYELMRRYTLTILARDGGGEETTGRLRVNVMDVNDNAPVFQKDAYMGSLKENEQSPQQVARVRVRQRNTAVGLLFSTHNRLTEGQLTRFGSRKLEFEVRISS